MDDHADEDLCFPLPALEVQPGYVRPADMSNPHESRPSAAVPYSYHTTMAPTRVLNMRMVKRSRYSFQNAPTKSLFTTLVSLERDLRPRILANQ